jgi:hypothetical protein
MIIPVVASCPTLLRWPVDEKDAHKVMANVVMTSVGAYLTTVFQFVH